MPPPYVLLPLASAGLYPFAAMALKRATGNGAGPWRISFVANWVQAICFAPFWLLGAQPFAWEHFAHAVLTGLIFFTGQILTFLALSRGDVSVTTPVLGTKVVFVALLSVAITHEPLSLPLWGASIFTIAATALLGGGKSTAGREAMIRSLIYGFTAALAFALTDVLVQKWAPVWTFYRFAPVMFFTVAIGSLGLIPLFSAPLSQLPPKTWRWLLPGSVLLSLQACGIAVAIMSYGRATLVNIVYATRGLFAVLIVWAVGRWFENEEHTLGSAVMTRRLLGACLLIAAVILALTKP